MEEMNVKISVTDVEPFKSLIGFIASLVTDERLSLEIRTEIMDKLEKITEGK